MAGQGQKTRAAKNREKRPSSRKRLKKGEVQDAVWNPKRRKREVEKKKADMPSTEEEEGGTLESPQIRKNSKKFVGAHVSIQGGIWNAVLVARQIGASAIGMFLGSQRTWKSKALDDKAAERFQRTCKELGFKSRYILPHSPYLMNLGSPKPDVLQKSQAMLVDELHKCHQLGLTMYNIHPGSCVGAMSVSKCLELIADGINLAHAQVPGVIVGHDLSKKAGLEHMLDEFNKVVGLSFLKAIHLNDSQGELGCKLDRHENIGHGHIGLEGFRHVMNEPRFNGIPMILETPLSSDDHAKEIELLYSLCAKGQRATKPKRKR
ncbi:hypothetical protein XENTR_v10012515 [Xenopus tropicalis]|nr:hypothetical protein XENTR_v10012515 [Xenopus tropicalis]